MIIGITGGIGSGKSLLGELLRERGYTVFNADEIAREVTAPGTEGLFRIAAAFGQEYLTEERTLDRRRLARLIFSNAAERNRLDEITHPLIRKRLEEMVRECGERTVFVEAPLLYESGMQEFFSEVWLIVADEKIRLDRIVARDGVTYPEAKARILSQYSDEEKRKHADVVLYNNGGAEDLGSELDRLLQKRGE